MHIEFFFMDADYIVEEGMPLIRLFGKTSDGKNAVLVDDSFEPYFYLVPRDNAAQVKKKLEEVEFKDDSNNKIKIKRIELVEKTINLEKREVLQLFTFVPADIPRISEQAQKMKEIEAKREFDIPFTRRYLYDKDLQPLTWLKAECEKAGAELTLEYNADSVFLIKNVSSTHKPAEDEIKILAFDIETVPNKEENEVIMISAATNKGLKKVLTFGKFGRDAIKNTVVAKDQYEMLKEFVELVKKESPDFIVSYNGDGFDFPLIKAAADSYKLDINFARDGSSLKFRKKAKINAAEVTGVVHIDVFQFISRVLGQVLKTEVLTLDNVSNELMGTKKIEMDHDEMHIWWTQQANIDKISEYCMHDSVLTLKLAEHILPNLFALSRLTNQLPFETCRSTYGQLVESFAIKKAFQLGYIVPNKPTPEEISSRMRRPAYEGAFVLQPKPGLHENIAVFDFRSLYPSIIISHNIDPDTFNCSCCRESKKNKVPERNYYFCTEKKGFVPQILGELIESRIEVKKKMRAHTKGTLEHTALDSQSFAFKTVANAFYGFLGFAGSRWYKYECAESTAAFARDYIHKTIETAQSMGLIALYADTDSCFLKAESNLERLSQQFLKKINDSLPGIMELEFEGFFRRGIFVARELGGGGAKKRYALIDESGEVTIRGFEKVRRDWSALAKETQEKVLRLVLNNKREEAIETVKRTIHNLKENKVKLEELIIYSQLTRPLDSYQQIGPHVLAARKAAAQGIPIRAGMIIPYIITRGAGRISDKAVFSRFAKSYDVDYYINNQILPAALRILKVLDIDENDLLEKAKQKGLMMFDVKKKS